MTKLYDQLKELAEKATPGPWRLSDSDPIEICQTALAVKVCSILAPHSNALALADAELIAALRNNLPAILSALKNEKDAKLGRYVREELVAQQEAHYRDWVKITAEHIAAIDAAQSQEDRHG